jgi:hypothetical protein
MGYCFAMSPCYGCGQPFTYNPMRVPSIAIEGVRRPICQSCVAIANPRRVANGLAPIEILPGAYEECDEAELE